MNSEGVRIFHQEASHLPIRPGSRCGPPWRPEPASPGQPCLTAVPSAFKGAVGVFFSAAERQMWTESLPVSWNLRAGGPFETGEEVDCLLIWCQGGNEMTLAREPGRPPLNFLL